MPNETHLKRLISDAVFEVTSLNIEVAPKRLELMHELLPSVTSMALLVNPAAPATAEPVSRSSQAAAQALGLQLHTVHASSDRDFDAVFERLTQLRVGSRCPSRAAPTR
jgi:putative tryptophan/tyrosine transport system substrate-binding protein